MTDLVVIRRFGYRHNGEMAQAALEAAGIPCMLQIDDAGGAQIGLSFVNSARLYVRAEDEDEARELLRDYGMLE